jgi:hypothetical protein
LSAAWVPAFLSALFGGMLAAAGAWVAIRVTLARIEQRLEAHDERLVKIEAAVGMDGKTHAAFIGRDEANARIQQAEQRWVEIRATLAELREMLAAVKAARVE